MRVLLIEDDHDLGEVLREALAAAHYTVVWARSGREGLYQAIEWEWDLIVLDRLLPELDGMSVLQKIRAAKSTPVLMLTALDTVDNRLEGLDTGADDYLGKPFDLREFLARVKALGRRAYGTGQGELTHGSLRLSLEEGRAFLREKELSLTRKEFQSLQFLLTRRGRVVTRMALEDLLAEGGEVDIQPNTLDVHMHRLRSKVGPAIIQTRRGQGYIIPEDAP
jgi:DNA-binding response OmpR family regulator